ncbi:MAG: carbonic anhydrase [Sulfurovum sp.]|nr:carbonic anhydrase [Sulfurovum sp.]
MRNISQYIYGNRKFQEEYAKAHSEKLNELAVKGQAPHALFIGCVDSRMLPNLITDTGPGELLVVRNVGNFIPPYEDAACEQSVASAMEFSVKVLKVKEIIVCGHTQCGAIYTIYSDLDATSFPHLSSWLAQGERLKVHMEAEDTVFYSKDEMLRRAEEVSVQIQLENLMGYPFVEEGVQNGTLQIHGWIYDIQSGAIRYYDEQESCFKQSDSVEESS